MKDELILTALMMISSSAVTTLLWEHFTEFHSWYFPICYGAALWIIALIALLTARQAKEEKL